MAWVESVDPLRRYARLVGAPNYAPSLCSVAGLLLALALQSGLRGPTASPAQVFPIHGAVVRVPAESNICPASLPREEPAHPKIRAGRPKLALGLCLAACFARACSYEAIRERRGVLVGALQSEREEETRD